MITSLFSGTGISLLGWTQTHQDRRDRHTNTHTQEHIHKQRAEQALKPIHTHIFCPHTFPPGPINGSIPPVNSIGFDRSCKPQVHTEELKCSASRKQGCYSVGCCFFSLSFLLRAWELYQYFILLFSWLLWSFFTLLSVNFLSVWLSFSLSL